MNKKRVNRLKKYLKTLPKTQIMQLCDDMMLSDYEKNLIIATYNGEKRDKICMDNYISSVTYTAHYHTILYKILNYYKEKGIKF